MTSDRDDLRADCARCVGLCCVALPFARSADFAVDKPEGMPCLHLRGDDRCGIHGTLRSKGFAGCVAYDCFGAGQQVTQVTFAGRSWRDPGVDAGEMFAVFRAVQPLHEMRWLLADAARRDLPGTLRDEVARQAERLLTRVLDPPAALRHLDVDAQRAEVSPILRRVSVAVRDAATPGRRRDLAGRDLAGRNLAGRNLAGRDLRGADLHGALLIAADLRRADLRSADLLGTDLRDANLDGADLRDALFLTAPQLGAAKGSPATRIPAWLDRPAHWS